MSAETADTWEVFDEKRPVLGGLYSPMKVRMVITRLKDGTLLVVSPGAPVSDARLQQLRTWGEVSILLAPCRFHYWGLKTWQEHFPNAKVVAHARAHKHLQKKVPGLVLEGLETLEPLLPEGVRLLCPPMARQGETWLSIDSEQGRMWCVNDGIVNLTRNPPGVLGALFWLLGFRPGLMLNPLFTRVFLTDKAAYKTWLIEALERDRPTRLIPAHGVPLEGADLTDRLLDATRKG